jgi:hypothetical protein
MSEEHLMGPAISACSIFFYNNGKRDPLWAPIVVQQWDPRVPTVAQDGASYNVNARKNKVIAGTLY